MSTFIQPAGLPLATSEIEVLRRPVESVQYTSDEFQKWCGTNGVTQSIGKVGVWWDNAVAENFFSHLKTEFYHHERYGSRLAARTGVMD